MLAVSCAMLFVSLTSAVAGQMTDQMFLQHQPEDSFQRLWRTSHGPQEADPLVVNTNAVLSAREESRFSALASLAALRVVRSVDGLSVLVDTRSKTLFIAGTAKGSGGSHVAFGYYTGVAPPGIPRYDLKGMTMAGLKLASSVQDVLLTFGIPSHRLRSSTTGIAGFRFNYSGADGVYRYVGPLPMKAQSCRRTFAITIRHRAIVTMSATVEC